MTAANRVRHESALGVFLLGLLLLSSLGAPSAHGAEAKDAKKDVEKVDLTPPGGIWKWTVTTDNGQTFEHLMKLKVENNQLSGTHTGRNGSEVPLREVTLQNNQIAFSVVRDRDGQKLISRYRGQLTGEVITGKVETDWNGETRTRDWLAQWQPPKPEKGGGITGAWKWTATGRDGQSYEARGKFKQDAEKLTGSVIGRNGRDNAIHKGTIKNEEFTFEVHYDFQGREVIVSHKGKVKGDKINGTIDMPIRDGGTRSTEWEAHRESEKDTNTVHLTGVWKWAIQANGQSFEPSVNLSHNGEMVTGKLTWGEHDVDIIDGLFKGAEISFTVTRERDGKKLVSKYAGKVEGDTIKGKVDSNFGGTERTDVWEARRAGK